MYAGWLLRSWGRLVSDYETGRLHLNDEMLARFVLALETSADVVLGISGNGGDRVKPSLKILGRLTRLEKLTLSQQRF